MTILCHIDEIPEGGSRGFTLPEQAVFVVKKAGNIYVYLNRCPHLGVQLEWVPDQFLDSDGEMIQCATHGALFLIDSGACVAGPCMGQDLQAIAFRVVDGRIEI